jgi:hypothetical protein
MSQNKFEWLRLLIPLVALVFVVFPLGQFLLREWYEPDVLYGTGGAYLSGNLAISNVELTNYGRAKEENITITATFADPLTEIGTGKTAIPFDISAGGIGQKFVTGSIKQLVPDVRVPIYFITAPSSPWADYASFIRSITSDHGPVKTGIPTLRTLPPLLLPIVVLGAIWGGAYYVGGWNQHHADARLSDAIQLGHSAAQEGLSEEQVTAKVEEQHRAAPFLRKGSKRLQILCAQSACAAAKKTLILTGGKGGTEGHGEPA